MAYNQQIGVFPRTIVYIVVGVFSVGCLLPFFLIISGSITDEAEIITQGFAFIPSRVSYSSWVMLYHDIGRIINGYIITVTVTVVGTFFSLAVTAMLAYPLSVPTLKYRNYIAFFAFFTMIFYGGMVPWYIIVSRVLHLRNTIFALIFPYTINAWNMFLLRNFFRTIPKEIPESAKIDGAGELTIFTRLIIPLAKPGLATVGLFIALGYWNDWWLGLMFIENHHLFPVQLLLRAIISNVQFLRSSTATAIASDASGIIPFEGVKMATGLVTIGPIIFLYPFIQKYFIKGIIVGAVKG
jgi:putative aldouronate transport system permease protein